MLLLKKIYGEKICHNFIDTVIKCFFPPLADSDIYCIYFKNTASVSDCRMFLIVLVQYKGIQLCYFPT